MKMGVLYSMQDPPGSTVGHPALYRSAMDQIVEAERLGYEWVNITEHHFAADGYLPAMLAFLAAAGARTTKMRLSTGMMILPLHDPLRIAEEAAVVDLISGGRLTLGVAAGYREAEFEFLGVDFKTRGKRFREQLELLVTAWKGEPFSFHGEVFDYEDVVVRPRPMQRPHPPLWLGGISPVALRRAVKWGSPCFPGATYEIELIKSTLDEYHQIWAETREDEPAGLVLPRVTVVADTVEEARRLALPGIRAMFETYESWGLPVEFGPILRDWGLLDEFVIVGDEEYCAERLQTYRELGTTDLMAQMALPGVEPAVSDESLQRLAKLACTPAAA